jgi:serine protease Do
VILSAEGLVVTNNHVVEGADKVSVRLHDDREFEAEVVGTDPKSDLAVLQLQGSVSGLVPIEIGDSAALRLGEVVLAVGNPFGVGKTVTMGIVSAKGRADVGIAAYEDFIQTDAAINPGNSGGALVNAAGQLVGINTAILSRSGGNVGIGFAIPTNMASPIIQALRDEGHVSRGFLGVTIQELDEDLRIALQVKAAHGVLLSDVNAGGPADEAGLESGDVVVAVNQNEMKSLGQFRNAIAAAGADKQVKLAIVRDGQEKEIITRLGQFPDEQRVIEAQSEEEQQKQTKWGLVLRELDPKMRGRLKVDSSVEGALIVRVDPSSPAARARLAPGDLVVAIDQQPVKNTSALVKVLLGSNDQHLLQILRRGARRYIVLKP